MDLQPARFNYPNRIILRRPLVNMLGKITAIAGFSFIVAPALLAENDMLDNTTFTVLFILGFLLVLVSLSTRRRSRTSLEQL